MNTTDNRGFNKFLKRNEDSLFIRVFGEGNLPVGLPAGGMAGRHQPQLAIFYQTLGNAKK